MTNNNVIRTIRNLMPRRPLSVAEALKYAEAQASQLLLISGHAEPCPFTGLTSGADWNR
jgi:hypothetical protein